MIAYIDPYRAPLRDVPAAMQPRRMEELSQRLEQRGIVIVGGDNDRIFLNLRNLAITNGSLDRGQQAIYAALEELACIRVDCETQDIGYLHGQNVESHAIARGLEAGVPTLISLLTSIEPSELFENLNKASAFIYQDRASDDVHERLKAGAAGDLLRSGLIGESAGDINALRYAEFLESPPDPFLVNLDQYARERGNDAAPFKSDWDLDEL